MFNMLCDIYEHTYFENQLNKFFVEKDLFKMK